MHPARAIFDQVAPYGDLPKERRGIVGENGRIQRFIIGRDKTSAAAHNAVAFNARVMTGDFDALATDANGAPAAVDADDVVADGMTGAVDVDCQWRRLSLCLQPVQPHKAISNDLVVAAGERDAPTAIPVGRVIAERPQTFNG